MFAYSDGPNRIETLDPRSAILGSMCFCNRSRVRYQRCIRRWDTTYGPDRRPTSCCPNWVGNYFRLGDFRSIYDRRVFRPAILLAPKRGSGNGDQGPYVLLERRSGPDLDAAPVTPTRCP